MRRRYHEARHFDRGEGRETIVVSVVQQIVSEAKEMDMLQDRCKRTLVGDGWQIVRGGIFGSGETEVKRCYEFHLETVKKRLVSVRVICRSRRVEENLASG